MWLIIFIFWLHSTSPLILCTDESINILIEIFIYLLIPTSLILGLFYSRYIYKVISSIILILPSLFALFIANIIYAQVFLSDNSSRFRIVDHAEVGSMSTKILITDGSAVSLPLIIVRQELDTGHGIKIVRNLEKYYTSYSDVKIILMDSNFLEFMNPYGKIETFTIKPLIYF